MIWRETSCAVNMCSCGADRIKNGIIISNIDRLIWSETSCAVNMCSCGADRIKNGIIIDK